MSDPIVMLLCADYFTRSADESSKESDNDDTSI